MHCKLVSRALLALIALTLLRGGSCVRIERPYAAPTADAVLEALRKRATRVRSLRAEARMSYRTDQGRVKATVRMMARGGGDLRFDVVSPFDTPLATLVCSGGLFSLVDSRKGRHFYGPASPCNLARLLQVALQPEDVLKVLGGATPLIAHVRAKLDWDERAGAEILTLESESAKQVIRLDGRDRRWRLLSSEIRDAKGRLRLKVVPGDYQKKAGIEVPGRIAVEQPLSEASLRLEFKTFEVNVELPAVGFVRPGASGLVSQHVDCATVVNFPKDAPASRPVKQK